MNNYTSVLILVASMFFISWGDSWDQIKKATQDVTSIEAEFVQSKHMEILSKPLVSKGMFYFKTPGSLRWEYASPIRSILLVHGASIQRYTKKGDAMIKDSTARLQGMRIVLQEIAMWMKGDFDSNPSFKPELKPGRIISLTPKEKSFTDIIQRIDLKLSDMPGVIKSVTIYESRKSYTLIEFRGVKLNNNIRDSLFKAL